MDNIVLNTTENCRIIKNLEEDKQKIDEHARNNKINSYLADNLLMDLEDTIKLLKQYDGLGTLDELKKLKDKSIIQKFLEHMMKISEDTKADEITYRWEMENGRKIGLCFTVFPDDKE